MIPYCRSAVCPNLMVLFAQHVSLNFGGIGENGFDMSRVGSNVGTMFGAGAYLAEASSKSDETFA